MYFKENALSCEEYCRLREDVGWMNFSKPQTKKLLGNSLYVVAAYEDGQAVGMGRLIGDGLYYMIVDVVIHPGYQRMGIGSKIFSMLIEYVDKEVPNEGCASVQLIAEKGKEPFYEERGFDRIPNESSGSGMRKIIYK